MAFWGQKDLFFNFLIKKKAKIFFLPKKVVPLHRI